MHPNSSNPDYATWSPTYGTDDPTTDVYSALKRAENIMYSIIRPLSRFNILYPNSTIADHGYTQTSFLRVPGEGLYYIVLFKPCRWYVARD